jgi:hypothetical protein
VGGEAELGFIEAGVHQHLGDMTVVEERIGGEILGHFTEMGLQAGFPPGAAGAAFGVADDPGVQVEEAGVDKGADGEIGGGRITTRIGEQGGATDGIAVELGKAVNGFGEPTGGGVGGFVPALVVFGGPEAERAAEVDDADAAVEQGRRKVDGDLGRGREEDGADTGRLNRFRGAGNALRAMIAQGLRPLGGIRAVFEQEGSGAGMAGENALKFNAAIAAEADDAYIDVHGGQGYAGFG